MSAKDKFHEAVKAGLQKDGWIITDDPLTMRLSRTRNIYIDLGAKQILGADRNGEKIAVEIKSFTGTSEIFDFHLAIGQFINYRYALILSWVFTRRLYGSLRSMRSVSFKRPCRNIAAVRVATASD